MIEDGLENNKTYWYSDDFYRWNYIGNYDDLMKYLSIYYEELLNWNKAKSINSNYYYFRQEKPFKDMVFEDNEDKGVNIHDLVKDVYDYKFLGKRFCKKEEYIYEKMPWEYQREERNKWYWKGNKVQYKIGKSFRKPRVAQERRLSRDKEVLPYVRAKRNKITFLFDFDKMPVCLETSWKRRYKVRKQYMKNL